MNNNWMKFVQINIYGKALKSFQEDGVCLENVMNNLGCDNFWIGEVPMYTGEMSDSEDNSDETILLNTTVAENRIPRSSTPVNSLVKPDFSLCASKILSPIQSENSEKEEDDEEMPYFDQSTEVCFVEETSQETIKDKENEIILSLLGTVVDIVCETEINVSTFFDCGNVAVSTVKTSPIHVIPSPSLYVSPDRIIENKIGIGEENGRIIENLVGNIIDIVCETESYDSTFYDCDMSLTSTTSSTSNLCQLPTLHGPHPHNRHSEYIESIEMKPSVPISKSLKNIKIGNISIKREERKPLKRTTSEKRITRRKAMKLIRNNSIHPILASSYSPPQIIKPIKIPRELSTEIFNSSQVMLPISEESERVYTDLEPMTSNYEYCDIEQNFFDVYDTEKPFNPAVSSDQIYYSQEDDHFEGIENDVSYENNQENCKEMKPFNPDVSFNSNHSQQQGRKEQNIEEVDDSLLYEKDQQNYDQGDWNDEFEENEQDDQNDSLLSCVASHVNNENEEDEGGDKNKKIRKRRTPKEPNNKMHNIVCKYKNCKFSYNWRPKFGKLRLLDHTLSHLEQKLLNCHDCDYSCQTSRQIRYHYLKQHKKSKISGYGINETFSLKIDDEKTIMDCWKSCYKDDLEIVGDAVMRRRRKSVE